MRKVSAKFDSGDQARVSYGQWTTPGPDQSAMRSPDGDILPAVENFSRSRSGVAKLGVLGALVLLLGGQMVLSAGVGSAATNDLSSGTFTVPAGVEVVHALAIGGGGGAGSSGGSGGAGCAAEGSFPVTPGNTLLGGAGTAGAARSAPVAPGAATPTPEAEAFRG